MDYARMVSLRRVLPATCAAILALITAGCGLGWLLHRSYPQYLSPVTALLGTMPGGASGLTAMAYDLGAEVQLVASIHMVRLIIVFGLLPLLLARFVRPAHNATDRRTGSVTAGDEAPSGGGGTEPDQH
jgi:membrane AbrB-like protein